MADTTVLVIGAGVVGLSSAYLLHNAGYKVTIYTKDYSQDTTSAVAGAFWEPHLVQPIEKAHRWSKFTYDYMNSNILPILDSGIREIVVNSYQNPANPDPWWMPIAKNFRHLEKGEMSDIYTSGWEYDSLLFDTTVYLPWLVSQLSEKGIEMKQFEVKSFEEVLPDFDLVVNCTGLGAKTLCNDDQVYPIRGQVLRVAPNGFDKVMLDENDDSIVYVVPRSSDMVIGGTGQVNDWNTQPDPKDTNRIINKLKKILPEFADVEVLEEKVGLRPARSKVRLETEQIGDKTIIHNYGHGGAGYTLSWGCANDVVNLVKELAL
jgi:D-amino-acid oxidase